MENENFESVYVTSRRFEDWLHDPTNPLVYCLLTLDGKDFIRKNSYEVKLVQKTADHDTFCITVPDDALDSFQGFVMENSKKLLGQEIGITYWRFGKPRHYFRGIIGKIRNKKDEGGGYGELYITGYAPSILLESGKDCQSFEDKTLEQIVKEITEEYPKEAKVEISSNYLNDYNRKPLPYTVQYKESDYQFIKRLAIRHGEFFYYNGEKLIFGNSVQPIIKLGENVDLIDVEFEMQMQAQDFTFVSYDAQSGTKIEKDSGSIKSEFKESPFQSIAVNSAGKIFRKKPKMHFNHTGINNNSEAQLSEAVRLEKERRENLMQVRGKSKDPELKIGGRAELSDINRKAMETYRIIEITHHYDGEDYYNEFVGIPDLFNAASYIDIEAVPKGEEQPARVIDNNDPMGMGRVKVQFPWQEEKNQTTPWIRLIQPHSGAGKGFHFIPEIGEEVLVGHESGNAEKPFVMGTHYNGKETSGYHTAGNDIKVIRTRSGIENLSNDAEGSWKQSTPDGNFLHFDGQGNATLNVPQKLIINATNIEINAFNNVEANVSNNMILNIMSQFFVFAPFMKQVISGFMNLFSGKALINSKETIHIEAEEVTTHGTEKMLVHSDKLTTINSMEVAEMHGATGNSFTNKPTPQKKKPADKITNTLVEFRPLTSWNGEVGYDWLRIDDNITGQETPYYDCLESGYEAPNGRDTNTEFDSKAEAFKALEKEYLQIPINRASNPNLKKYYVPWLNLYPEAVNIACSTSPKPPCEMELRVLVDVETEEPDQIRIVFSKDYFTINGNDGTDANPVLIADKAIATKHDTGTTIKIKCIKEFSTRQEITVYAYPKDSLLKTPAEQLTLRKVAGRIVLEPNKNTVASNGKPTVKNTKELKVVLVGVKTNIFNVVNGETTGIFDSGLFAGEKNNMVNMLHQSLIHATFIENDSAGNPLELDVSANAAFQQRYNSAGVAIGSTYISIDDKIKANAHSALKTLFNAQTHNAYANDLLVFSFDAEGAGSFVGVAEDIGKKSLILVKTRNPMTMPHEGSHCLGLWHTHQDASIVWLNNTTPTNSTGFNYPNNRGCIYVGTDNSQWMYNGTTYVAYNFYAFPETIPRDKKLIYHHAHIAPTLATYNIMSYNGILRKYTWHWQWKLLKKNAR
ncbi:hypothetical protein GCM10023210_07340 [Chryseobacterium ginsengisoli]|uniref:Gp5/Type VI secretion system Vgr protein OB-fold domain-containing protein n=1 Tax=Chryseobacterium ginsengisoli TaxID=363853 RepID=A0ABP9LYE4_9FLAO